MKKFTIILVFKKRQHDGTYYVEYAPDNEYDDDVKKCDTVIANQVEDLIYLEQVTVELYTILEDKFGTEFTSKYIL